MEIDMIKCVQADGVDNISVCATTLPSRPSFLFLPVFIWLEPLLSTLL